MQNFQSSNPTVAKLLEADADLAAQEAQLSTQLTSLQNKRHSLKTAIDMFAPANTNDTVPVATPPVATPAPVAEAPPQSTAPDDVPPELNGALADTTQAQTSVAPQPQKQQSKKNSSTPTTGRSKKSAPTGKQSKATDTWQQYVKDEFYGATLSEAVSEVMQQHKKQVVEIAARIDAIFTSNIPKELRSTARERVSNVLSVGAKNGKWYRGQLGKYSMSQTAVKG